MSRSLNRPSSRGGRTCELPVGLETRGKVEKTAVLRAPGDASMLRLSEVDHTEPRERLLSVALSCCVERLGSLDDPSPEVMHQLALCDRHALVRSLMLAEGVERVAVVGDCSSCRQKLELVLDLGAVRLQAFASPKDLVLTRKRKGHIESHPVRLPRPADVEGAAGEEFVVAACLGLEPWEAASWMRAADKFFSKSDPLGYLEIAGQCPECDGKVSAGYDLAAAWLRRIQREADEILREVHLLALRYHWSEREVLSLPGPRRRAYCRLCDEMGPAEAGV